MQFNAKGHCVNLYTSLGDAPLKAWALLNTPFGKETYVFERDTAKIIAHFVGNKDDLPTCQKGIFGFCDEVLGIPKDFIQNIKHEPGQVSN